MFRRLFNPFAGLLFEDPDDTAAGGEPAAEVPAAPEPPAPAEPAPGPWASDLETRFEDPAVRSQVDAYLRETVQPRITHLEQQYAGTEDARRLLSDFQDDPFATFQAVASELDQTLGERVSELIEAGVEPADAKEIAADEQEAQELDPRVAEMVEEHELRKAEEAYTAGLESTGVPEAERTLFHPFVLSSSGDFEAAKAAYDRWKSTAQTTFGWQPPAVPTPEAPAALGTASDAPPAPHVQPQYASLDDALDATLDEMRANRDAPTPVGTV